MRKYKMIYFVGLLLAVMSCDPSNAGNHKNSNNTSGTGLSTSDDSGKYKLADAFPNLDFEQPVELTSPDDNTHRIFIIAQKGVIHVIPNKPDVKKSSVFLDIVNKVESGGEKGLLGLAFHPDYKNNGYFYVNYTHGDPLETVISRFKVSSTDPNIADPKSEVVLLRYRQPYDNHNGGKVAFGNDGFLYIAVGDGGSGGDPGNRG
jgi:glucose/arabinose dehydrogenase